MPEFTDQFSIQAERYRRFRPGYPAELYDHLLDLVRSRDLAWDCATGNGQAAVELGERFEKVLATDASTSQIEHARPHPRVEYRVATAEDSGLPDESADLITVANAIHWFSLESFYEEARRVLKKGGILAAWCYENFETEESVKHAFTPLYNEISGCWAPQLDHVRSHYRSIELPLEPVEAPHMEMRLNWTLDQCLGYLSSWSAVQNYINTKDCDPIALHYDQIEEIWGDPGTARAVTWKLHMRIGRR
ncbi:MAG: class I SAM-dependent methyltransferase [Candidatus Melainabacteria bacterium]|nr:class I SAM-dependent methyltransferase [Candidatus Melainabacteria bacterium]